MIVAVDVVVVVSVKSTETVFERRFMSGRAVVDIGSSYRRRRRTEETVRRCRG